MKPFSVLNFTAEKLILSDASKICLFCSPETSGNDAGGNLFSDLSCRLVNPKRQFSNWILPKMALRFMIYCPEMIQFAEHIFFSKK